MVDKGISLKGNEIVQLKFELAYYDIAIQHINYYTTDSPPHYY